MARGMNEYSILEMGADNDTGTCLWQNFTVVFCDGNEWKEGFKLYRKGGQMRKLGWDVWLWHKAES
jgi:hypothetical protein